MSKSPPPDPSTTVGDQIKHLLAEYIHNTLGTELPPMVGAFTIVGEYTDSFTGSLRFVSFNDTALPPWQEIGLLQTRLSIVLDQVVKKKGL